MVSAHSGMEGPAAQLFQQLVEGPSWRGQLMTPHSGGASVLRWGWEVSYQEDEAQYISILSSCWTTSCSIFG